MRLPEAPYLTAKPFESMASFRQLSVKVAEYG
jgi:hypothetical protein